MPPAHNVAQAFNRRPVASMNVFIASKYLRSEGHVPCYSLCFMRWQPFVVRIASRLPACRPILIIVDLCVAHMPSPSTGEPDCSELQMCMLRTRKPAGSLTVRVSLSQALLARMSHNFSH